MKKSLLAFAAAATLAASAIAPAPAQAQRGVAAGVAAGIIGGAIVGGALASPYYYGPGPGYYYGPGYYPATTARAMPPMTITAAASGSGSAFGTAMPGVRAACASAAEEAAFPRIRAGTAGFLRGSRSAKSLKKTAFSRHSSVRVYGGLTICALPSGMANSIRVCVSL